MSWVVWVWCTCSRSLRETYGFRRGRPGTASGADSDAGASTRPPAWRLPSGLLVFMVATGMSGEVDSSIEPHAASPSHP